MSRLNAKVSLKHVVLVELRRRDHAPPPAVRAERAPVEAVDQHQAGAGRAQPGDAARPASTCRRRTSLEQQALARRDARGSSRAGPAPSGRDTESSRHGSRGAGPCRCAPARCEHRRSPAAGAGAAASNSGRASVHETTAPESCDSPSTARRSASAASRTPPRLMASAAAGVPVQERGRQGRNREQRPAPRQRRRAAPAAERRGPANARGSLRGCGPPRRASARALPAPAACGGRRAARPARESSPAGSPTRSGDCGGTSTAIGAAAAAQPASRATCAPPAAPNHRTAAAIVSSTMASAGLQPTADRQGLDGVALEHTAEELAGPLMPDLVSGSSRKAPTRSRSFNWRLRLSASAPCSHEVQSCRGTIVAISSAHAGQPAPLRPAFQGAASDQQPRRNPQRELDGMARQQHRHAPQRAPPPQLPQEPAAGIDDDAPGVGRVVVAQRLVEQGARDGGAPGRPHRRRVEQAVDLAARARLRPRIGGPRHRRDDRRDASGGPGRAASLLRPVERRRPGTTARRPTRTGPAAGRSTGPAGPPLRDVTARRLDLEPVPEEQPFDGPAEREAVGRRGDK